MGDGSPKGVSEAAEDLADKAPTRGDSQALAADAKVPILKKSKMMRNKTLSVVT